jgi:plasmid stabilization system protein ParE
MSGYAFHPEARNDLNEIREYIHGLAAKRPVASSWAPQMLAYHRYDHVSYSDYIDSGTIPTP